MLLLLQKATAVLNISSSCCLKLSYFLSSKPSFSVAAYAATELNFENCAC
jgi:hypothetical protein